MTMLSRMHIALCFLLLVVAIGRAAVSEDGAVVQAGSMVNDVYGQPVVTNNYPWPSSQERTQNDEAQNRLEISRNM